MSILGVEPLPFDVSTALLGGHVPGDYSPELLVVAAGYESRSRYVASLLLGVSRDVVVSGFESHHVLSYEANMAYFKEQGLEVAFTSADDYRSWIRRLFLDLARGAGAQQATPVIGVDVSSLSRDRLADIALVLREMSDEGLNIIVDLFYAPAAFQRHDPNREGPLDVAEPVRAEFAGWYSRVELPLTLIVGLGYEPGRASAGIDLLEPAAVFAFVPRGLPSEGRGRSPYDQVVVPANELLLERTDVRSITYDVGRPYELFSELFALTSGLLDASRPIILPMGPKMFAMASLLVAIELGKEVAVWRLSAGPFKRPTNAEPAGSVVGLRTHLTGSLTSG